MKKKSQRKMGFLLVFNLYQNLTADYFLVLFFTQNTMHWYSIKRLSAFESTQIKIIEKHIIMQGKFSDEKPFNDKKALFQCTYLPTHNSPLGKKLHTGSNDQKIKFAED